MNESEVPNSQNPGDESLPEPRRWPLPSLSTPESEAAPSPTPLETASNGVDVNASPVDREDELLQEGQDRELPEGSAMETHRDPFGELNDVPYWERAPNSGSLRFPPRSSALPPATPPVTARPPAGPNTPVVKVEPGPSGTPSQPVTPEAKVAPGTSVPPGQPTNAWQFTSPSPLAPGGLLPQEATPVRSSGTPTSQMPPPGFDYSGIPGSSSPAVAPGLPGYGSVKADSFHATESAPRIEESSLPLSDSQHSGFGDPRADGYFQSMPPGGPALDSNTSSPNKSKGIWSKIVVTAAVSAVAASALTGVVMQNYVTNSASSPSSYTSEKANQGSSPVTNSTITNPDWPQVAAAVSGSVAAITVTDGRNGSEGSGVLYDDQGHIVTNNHVIAEAVNGSAKITVALASGQLFEATVVGTDPATDLAVIKLSNPPESLKPATFGDSSKTSVGEPVMAVGNPLGLDNTATTGIISALNRPVSTAADSSNQVAVTNALQMDAAVNPGNSGGPAFNAFGEVIGITSSIATLSESSSSQSGSIGLGFAIPSNQVKMIVDQLIETGSAKHAFLGVSLLDGAGQADGSTWKGAQVQSVSQGKPAAKAGIKVGDVIIAIDGEPISGQVSLTAYVRGEAVGSTVKLTIIRDGKTIDQEVTLVASES